MEDRRGRRPGGGGGLRIGGGLGLAIILVVVLMGGDPRQVLEVLVGGEPGGGGGLPAPPADGRPPAADQQLAEMSRRVLGLTEDTWNGVFREAGLTYQAPTLVLFTDRVSSACGLAGSATGPFYCPSDGRLYLDLGFFHQLAGMAGIGSDEFDFAAAYVIAHEVGHHVQNLLGTSDEVRRAQAGSGAANRLSVLLELQADCYAGVFANRARGEDGRGVLEEGDVDEGMRTAAAIGDDRLMRGAGREVSPESFTHGSSEQRVNWLRTGMQTGDPDACDTFARAGYR